MLQNVKNMLLAIPEDTLLAKVERVLRLYWSDEELENLPRMFGLVMDQIRNTQTYNQHNLLIGAPGYLLFPGGPELFKTFIVFDEDELTADFDFVPEFDSIRLWSWEEKEGPVFDFLNAEQCQTLNALPYPEPICEDMGNLSLFLGARIPNLHGKKAAEKTAIVYLAMLLDHFSGRRESARSDTKWGLFNRISIYNVLVEIRNRILEDDI